MTNIEIFKNIIQRIDITAERTILLDQKPYGEKFNNGYISKPSNKMLFDMLQNLIYATFYSGANTAEEINDVKDFYKIENETKAFNDALSKYNYSKEKMDYDWEIDQIDMMGNLLATKGNLKRQLHVGEFLNDSGFGRSTSKKEKVKLYMRKEFKSPQSGFYYIFGNSAGEDNQDMLVRIYFNIKPNAVHKLIELFSTEFNNYKIPFSFKCLNHPSYYKRKDTAVLYIDKKYYKICSSILAQHYSSFKDDLINETPLFTFQLASGIAFAENPYKMDESFGTHCSKMITQGIMGAYQKNLPKTEWIKEIIYTIEKVHHYKSVELLYKNPESNYPYDFFIFKN